MLTEGSLWQGHIFPSGHLIIYNSKHIGQIVITNLSRAGEMKAGIQGPLRRRDSLNTRLSLETLKEPGAVTMIKDKLEIDHPQLNQGDLSRGSTIFHI